MLDSWRWKGLKKKKNFYYAFCPSLFNWRGWDGEIPNQNIDHILDYRTAVGDEEVDRKKYVDGSLYFSYILFYQTKLGIEISFIHDKV